MDWTLELIVVPVSDVDRSKSFYVEQAGFNLEVDHSAGESFRVVQMTPPGSACSIAIGVGIGQMVPGTLKGLHLIVPDIDAARAELVERGVDASELFHFTAGGQTPGPDPARQKYGTFLSFDDPDGNSWLVQEVNRSTPSA
jgi:catechol 2,3-dioxygenase-like lactoylglutathione lyase family enzyme